jgi:hypothetical protein
VTHIQKRIQRKGKRLHSAKSWSRRGLARKVVAYTFPVIFLIVLATQLTVGWLNISGPTGYARRPGPLIASLTAKPWTRPVWNMDQAVYESQIRAIARTGTSGRPPCGTSRARLLFELGPDAAGRRFIEVTSPVIGAWMVGKTHGPLPGSLVYTDA